MDEKTHLLIRAINEGVESTLWAALASAMVGAGVAVFLGAYLAKK